MGDLKIEYEASLKSIETENKLDRVFYRPIGFRIARLLTGTGITPNMITIISIFVGGVVGYFFYLNDIIYSVIGILLLVFANILDCVDGQLARMTGIKSAIGRILDGLAGDVWFASIYVGLAYRLMGEYGTPLFFGLAVLSGLSHLVQANITDYYKTLHLFFISKEKGSEFQTLQQVKENHKAMKPGINKAFYVLYIGYTYLQVKATPSLQRMLSFLSEKFGNDIPESLRTEFRAKSSELMPYIDMLTFNGRTVIMFFIILTGHVWVYFLYEIIVLNCVLLFVMNRHEKICTEFLNKFAYEKNCC